MKIASEEECMKPRQVGHACTSLYGLGLGPSLRLYVRLLASLIWGQSLSLMAVRSLAFCFSACFSACRLYPIMWSPHLAPVAFDQLQDDLSWHDPPTHRRFGSHAKAPCSPTGSPSGPSGDINRQPARIEVRWVSAGLVDVFVMCSL